MFSASVPVLGYKSGYEKGYEKGFKVITLMTVSFADLTVFLFRDSYCLSAEM